MGTNMPRFLGCDSCSGNIWMKLPVIQKGKDARASLAMPVRKSEQGPEAMVRNGALALKSLIAALFD